MTFRMWSSHRIFGSIVPPWTRKPFSPFTRAEERLASFSILTICTLLDSTRSVRATVKYALRRRIRKNRTMAVRDGTMSSSTLHTDARRPHVVELPKMGCLTTKCHRVSCNRVRDGCVSQSTPEAMLDDHMSSSDLFPMCLTTWGGYAASVTALSDVVKRVTVRCVIARCRRAPCKGVLDDFASESTFYSHT